MQLNHTPQALIRHSQHRQGFRLLGLDWCVQRGYVPRGEGVGSEDTSLPALITRLVGAVPPWRPPLVRGAGVQARALRRSTVH